MAVPPEIPPTTPVVLIVPTAVLLLDQVPPAKESLKEMVEPWHTLLLPVIIDGAGFTVMVSVTTLPQLSV